MTPQARAKIKTALMSGLTGVAIALTAEAKIRATKNLDNGTRRNSITHVKQENAVLWGIPKNQAPHAVLLEQGFKPHWVPMRYISLWARRHGVGQVYATRINGRRVRTYKQARATKLGVFVGGPNSSLQYGGAGATAMQFRGRGRRVSVTYPTPAGRSPYLPAGKVGSPILQPTIKEDLARVGRKAFIAGFKRGLK